MVSVCSTRDLLCLAALSTSLPAVRRCSSSLAHRLVRSCVRIMRHSVGGCLPLPQTSQGKVSGSGVIVGVLLLCLLRKNFNSREQRKSDSMCCEGGEAETHVVKVRCLPSACYVLEVD